MVSILAPYANIQSLDPGLGRQGNTLAFATVATVKERCLQLLSRKNIGSKNMGVKLKLSKIRAPALL
ncbi:hypothetical protein KFK09_025397 [Dendrobium nobile]|uniref:Uncharacterized protein n=1 Tax=Dendrobium nobile TaxID=94219 RepID=A0A8T3AG17_DENNO|nr:hypothetical protein KFK09_025397 [Dendrobium nobile]